MNYFEYHFWYRGVYTKHKSRLIVIVHLHETWNCQICLSFKDGWSGRLVGQNIFLSRTLQILQILHIRFLMCNTFYNIFNVRRDIVLNMAYIYSRVSFCDGSFYDDSLLRPLSSRTEHSRIVVHHCRNSSILSVLSALLALFRCACVSSFSILVQFF